MAPKYSSDPFLTPPHTPNSKDSSRCAILAPNMMQTKHGEELTKWVTSKEAKIIMTLLTEKAAGNVAESSFKPQVWKRVMEAVAGLSDAGPRKDVKHCKSRFQRVCKSFFFI